MLYTCIQPTQILFIMGCSLQCAILYNQQLRFQNFSFSDYKTVLCLVKIQKATEKYNYIFRYIFSDPFSFVIYTSLLFFHLTMNYEQFSMSINMNLHHFFQQLLYRKLHVCDVVYLISFLEWDIQVPFFPPKFSLLMHNPGCVSLHIHVCACY